MDRAKQVVRGQLRHSRSDGDEVCLCITTSPPLDWS